MKKLLTLTVLFILSTSCFKTDLSDHEKGDHFYFSDYYLNQFPNFEMEVLTNERFGSGPGYYTRITYRVDSTFYNTLKQNWNDDIRINGIRITDENKIFGRTLGPGPIGENYNLGFKITLDGATAPKAEESYTLSVSIP